MAVACDECGAEVTRFVTTFRKDGSARTQCRSCAGLEGKFITPSDRKLWVGPDFAPEEYERVNGKLQLKPEYQAALEESTHEVTDAAYAAAVAHKREQARQNPQTPATPEQIEELRRQFREWETRLRAETAGLILPE